LLQSKLAAFALLHPRVKAAITASDRRRINLHSMWSLGH
jgi:hypothetical protein